MTTHYHTPLSGADIPSFLPTLNTQLSTLDAAIFALSGGDSGSTAVRTTLIVTAGEGFADRAAAYVDADSGLAYAMDSNSTPVKAGLIRGFIDGSTLSGEDATLVVSGLLNGFSGLTAHLPVYVDVTAGEITQTKPEPSKGSTQIAVIPMGFAVAADTVIVAPQPVQYAKRAALLQGETIELQHHADDGLHGRNLRAYITTTVAGATISEHDSTNEDTQYNLRGPVPPASYTADQCSGGTPSSSETTSNPPAYAFDENAATRWVIANTTGWIEYDFGSNKTIRRYRITAHSTPSRTPSAWTLEYYDGAAWQTADTRSSQTAWSSAEVRQYDVSSDFTAQRWRLNITDNDGDPTYLEIREIDMYEVASTGALIDSLAQTFTLSVTQTVESVSVYTRKVGSPTGTVTIRIETVSDDEPSGVLANAAASVTFAESELSSSFAMKLVAFASTFSLSPGTYAIVVSTSRAQSDTNYIEWGADSGAGFANGTMLQYADSAWADLSEDAIFAIAAPGQIYPTQAAVDWWGSGADLVNRYGDTGGASISTKTTLKCNVVAGLDDVMLVVDVP